MRSLKFTTESANNLNLYYLTVTITWKLQTYGLQHHWHTNIPIIEIEKVLHEEIELD